MAWTLSKSIFLYNPTWFSLRVHLSLGTRVLSMNFSVSRDPDEVIQEHLIGIKTHFGGK